MVWKERLGVCVGVGGDAVVPSHSPQKKKSHSLQCKGGFKLVSPSLRVRGELFSMSTI